MTEKTILKGLQRLLVLSLTIYTSLYAYCLPYMYRKSNHRDGFSINERRMTFDEYLINWKGIIKNSNKFDCISFNIGIYL